MIGRFSTLARPRGVTRTRPGDNLVRRDDLSLAGYKAERGRGAVITRSLRLELLLPVEEHDEW